MKKNRKANMKKNKKSNPKQSIQAGAKSQILSKTKKSGRAVGGRVQGIIKEKEGKNKNYQYKVIVNGTGILLLVGFKLDDVNIDLVSSDGKKWEGSKSLLVGEKVNIKFECSAPTGTDWQTIVTNITKNKAIQQKRGKTGAMNRAEYEDDVPSE
jgi:hypothetical protein